MKIENIIEQIGDKAPALLPYLKEERSITEVSKELLDYNPDETHIKRQEKYIDLIKQKIKKIFSEDEQKDIQIFSNPYVTANTVDHLGFPNHPAMVSAYMTMGFSRIFSQENSEREDDLLILSTTAVALNDYFHKRGFDFNGKHINMTKKKDRNKLLYLYPKINISIIDTITKDGKIKSFSKNEVEFLEKIDEIIKNIDFSTCDYYSEQLTKINFYLWPLMLPIDVREKAPNLLTIESENTDIEYLKILLKEKKSFIVDVLFDKEKRDKIMQIFSGATGCWDLEIKKGSHFFWKITNKKFEKLILDGEKLVDQDNNYSVDLNTESLIKALKNNEIFPTMFISYGIDVMYCGIKSLMGYGSVQYVTDMKNRWLSYFKEFDQKEHDLLEKVITSSYSNSSLNFSRKEGELVQDYAFDILYQGGKPLSYYEKMKEMPYKYLQYPIIPDFAEYYLENKKDLDIDNQELMKPFDWIE